MNIELLEYCLKGLRKRWKEVLRTSIVIFIAFTFVAGTLIFQSNMYKWQIQSAKSRFGSWYVMYEGSVKAENNDLKNHPYLGTAGLAQVNNYVYNSVGKTDISIGTLSDRFIEIGNIKLNKGRMPAKDNEIAVEWSTLIKLEQGSDKVKESVLMLSDISEIYVNNFGKMLTDKNFSQRELNAIAAGYNTIMKKSSRSIAELKNIINPTGMSMNDKERIDLVNRVYREMTHYKED